MKDEELAAALGNVFRLARLEKGYSQVELANLCGLQRPSLAAVERGERAVTVEIARRIASALQLRLVEIFQRLEDAAGM